MMEAALAADLEARLGLEAGLGAGAATIEISRYYQLLLNQ